MNIRMIYLTAFLFAIVAGCGSPDVAPPPSDEGDDPISIADESEAALPDEDVLSDPDEGIAGAEILSADVEEITEEVGDYATIVYFDFDKSDLTAEAVNTLDTVVQVMLDSDRVIRLEGHADARGTREYNLALGERRAMSVADYLVFNGVPRDRIEPVSYGEESPVAFGNNEAAWAQNRRVEIK